MKSEKLKKLIKAYEKGKILQVFKKNEWVNILFLNLPTLKTSIKSGEVYRVTPKKKNKTFEFFGVVSGYNHKITFEVNKNNKPILETVKMFKL
jgi:hypothetical protein